MSNNNEDGLNNEILEIFREVADSYSLSDIAKSRIETYINLLASEGRGYKDDDEVKEILDSLIEGADGN